jgi:hypothetical protein
MMAYRQTEHESTGFSPNLLMFGRETWGPIDLMMGLPPGVDDELCPVEYVEWMKNAMRDNSQLVREHLSSAAKHQKRNYDRGLKARSYDEGSWVWRWYPPQARVKLGLGWTGPYLVVRRITEVTYQIQLAPERKPIVVHVDHL